MPEEFIPVCTVEALSSAGKLVVDHAGTRVIIFWNGGTPGAMNELCIHRERSLAQGVLLNGRVVCPGHQWAFALEDGFCRERDRTQPTYTVEIRDGHVLLSPVATFV
jgi:nitrite reductase (NADH) small subunit